MTISNKKIIKNKYWNISLTLMLILSFASKVQAQSSALKKEDKKPNIIFILTDDQRFDALGYQGNKLVHTPEMDKLAKSGTYFKNALVTTPICAASRASIFTGLQERAHNYNFQTGAIREEYMNSSYPKVLKNAGYYTGFYGKFGVNYENKEELFDEYESYDRNLRFKDKRSYFYKTIDKDTVHLTRYTGQQGIDFIDNVSTKKPFCLQLSFSAPHAQDSAKDQYFWQNETDGLLQNTIIPKPNLGEATYFNEQPEMVKAGFNRLRWTWRYETPEKYQHSVKGYYRMISGIDLEIEKIRKKLEEKGLAENTIIIVMGDNGYFLGERQFAGKWLMYDNSVRVPLIIYDPRINNHQDIEAMALNTDVPATILDYANVQQPKTWQGKSLKNIVNGDVKTVNRDTVLIEHLWDFEKIPPSEGIRTKKWKYFRYVNDKSIEELYDLEKDPQEINNLVKKKKYTKILQNLRAKCEQLILEKSNSYTNPPNGLTVEFIRNTKEVLINDEKPEFSWLVPQTVSSQSAYQLLVSSTEDKITNNIGDVWNSQRVNTNKSSNVEHQGNKLEAGETYFWKVRIWDEDSRLLKYSDIQSFKMSGSKNGLTTANSFQIDTIKPKIFKKNNDNSYFIDFGKAAFATINFKYKTTKKETLVFHIGEQLDNGSINRKPNGSIRYQRVEVPVNPKQTNYTLSITPDVRNTKTKAIALPKYFPVLMPFRYAEIENTSTTIQAKDIQQLAYHSYWDEHQSDFKSSHDILNQVWELCKYSIKATTFSGLYVDGDRERIPYEADAYLNQLSHYTTDQEYAIARQTIEYFMENPTWPTEWQLHVALMFHADYMYTGNTELIEKYYEELKYKTLKELVREDGLISSSNATPEFMKKLGFKNPKTKLKDIVDWPPAQKDVKWKLATEEGERDGYVFTPINTVVNAFYFKNMEIMAEFANILQKPEEALEFQLLALKAKQAINKKLFNKNLGIYTDGEGTDHSSLHANMMVLAFHIVPEKHKKTVADFIKSRGMACSVYGSQYLLEALYNANEADYALDLMTATHDRSWYNMIKIGSTITLEAWDMKYKPNSDWNHAWGATPANIISRNLWGIQPKTAGYETAIIQPQLGSLKNSSIKVPTIKGIIKADYHFSNNRKQEYTIEIPSNMVADFKINMSSETVVILNGKKVSTAFGSIRLTSGFNKIELVINSF